MFDIVPSSIKVKINIPTRKRCNKPYCSTKGKSAMIPIEGDSTFSYGNLKELLLYFLSPTSLYAIIEASNN